MSIKYQQPSSMFLEIHFLLYFKFVLNIIITLFFISNGLLTKVLLIKVFQVYSLVKQLCFLVNICVIMIVQGNQYMVAGLFHILYFTCSNILYTLWMLPALPDEVLLEVFKNAVHGLGKKIKLNIYY